MTELICTLHSVMPEEVFCLVPCKQMFSQTHYSRQSVLKQLILLFCFVLIIVLFPNNNQDFGFLSHNRLCNDKKCGLSTAIMSVLSKIESHRDGLLKGIADDATVANIFTCFCEI